MMLFQRATSVVPGVLKPSPKWVKNGWLLGRVIGLPLRLFFHRRNLLVILSGSLGDALLFSGALREIRRAAGGKHIVLVVTERAYPVLAGCPHVDEILVPPLRDGVWPGLARIMYAARIFARRYDLVLCPAVIRGEESEFISALATARRRVLLDWRAMGTSSGEGDIHIFQEHPFASKSPRLSQTSPSRGIDVAVASSCGGRSSPEPGLQGVVAMHELDRTVGFLQAAGFNDVKSREDIRPETYVTDSERAVAQREIEHLRRQRPGALIVSVCAGARFKQKDWGVANWVELLRRLGERRPVVALLLGGGGDKASLDAIEAGLARVSHVAAAVAGAGATGHAVTGAATEGRADTAESVAAAVKRWPLAEKSHAVTGAATGSVSTVLVVNKARQTSLHESIALIEKSDLCLGNDTFGLHAAIAVGTPSVVVMWGGDGERWVPWGDPVRHRMVHAGDRSCFGCRGECIWSEFRCMKEIAVEDVLREVLFLRVL